MPPVRFDWTISFGHITSLALVLLTAAVGYLQLQFVVVDHEKRLAVSAVEIQRAHDRLNAKDVADAEVRAAIRQIDALMIEVRDELRELNRSSQP